MTNIAIRSGFKEFNKYNFDKFEFGTPSYYGCYMHKVSDDLICISYQGHRIFEAHSDGSSYFVITNNSLTDFVLKRWMSLFSSNIWISKKRRKRLGNVIEYDLEFSARVMDSAGVYTWEKKASVTASSRIQVTDSTGNVCISRADAPIVVSKSTDKYKLFCKDLKDLKSTLIAQAKLGVYDKYSGVSHYSFKEELSAIMNIGDTYAYYNDVMKFRDDAIAKWIETRDPTLVKNIAICTFRLHSSYASGIKNIVNRINSSLKSAQATYLRDHCVTISGSPLLRSINESDDNDKDSELLQITGLREMQIPSEAQVC